MVMGDVLCVPVSGPNVPLFVVEGVKVTPYIWRPTLRSTQASAPCPGESVGPWFPSIFPGILTRG